MIKQHPSIHPASTYSPIQRICTLLNTLISPAVIKKEDTNILENYQKLIKTYIVIYLENKKLNLCVYVSKIYIF